ncbi:uncharacterized protein LOC135094181 [Scylla paramamosain]|uniref:uncharacterized protein LOC135094181 n=1 Tax=Scylla paramamosain TaxID=85552 RepID=UPI003083AD97
MESVLLLLVVAVVAALGSEGASSFTHAVDCSAADILVGNGEAKLIESMNVKGGAGYFNLYMKPESGFKGVQVQVEETDGANHSAWFRYGSVCFPRREEWVQFMAGTWITRNGLFLRFRSSKCWFYCKTESSLRQPISLSMVAHGPSRWMKGFPPKECGMIYYDPATSEYLNSCSQIPFTTTATSSTNAENLSIYKLTLNKKTIIAVLAAGVAVVAAVVVVVAVWQKQNCVTLLNMVRLHPRPAVPSSQQQPTTGQGHAPDQHDETLYYDILPEITEPGVMGWWPAVSSHPLQFTPDQRNEGFFYETPSDCTARQVAVVVPQLSQDSTVNHDVLPKSVQSCSPNYENITPAGGGAYPRGHLQALGVRGSYLYATMPRATRTAGCKKTNSSVL